MNKFKTGSFVLFGIFIIFWVWILLAVLNNTTPRKFIKNIALVFNNQIEKPYIIPVSFYENQDWINDISPDATTLSGLSESNNQISIEFNRDMDTSFYQMKKSSIYTIGDSLEFDMNWKNKRSFLITLTKELKSPEYFIIKLDFRDSNNYYLPDVVLNYE